MTISNTMTTNGRASVTPGWVQNRVMIDCAILATATSAWGLVEWHRLFKPATMLAAMFLVANHDHLTLGMRRKDREKRLERRLGASQRAAA